MRCSVTKLEAYRRFRDYPFVELAEVEAAIRGEFVEKPEMVRGAAFHEVVANPARYRAGDFYRAKGWRFHVAETDQAIARIGAAVCEVPGEFKIGGHTVTMKADGMRGRTVLEVKVPSNPAKFEVEWYEDSYQWRLYLLGFDADVCEYHVVGLEVPDENAPEARPVEALSHVAAMLRYSSLEADVLNLVQDFEAFVLERHLACYVEEKEKT